MRIGICTIAYNQPGALVEMATSALRTCADAEFDFHIFIHNPSIRAACGRVKDLTGATLYDYGTNRGVAKSWNDGILIMAHSGCDVLLVANDDIVFDDQDIYRIAEASMLNRDKWAVFCTGWQDKKRVDHGMACFALNPIALEKVGMFDENFFPAYDEDCDYAYRAESLAGLQRTQLDSQIRHVGSSTIKASPALRQQNHHTHDLNNKYYIAKWGGLTGDEKYRVPFMSQHFHPYYIDPESRHAPYPGFNRTDTGIVKL